MRRTELVAPVAITTSPAGHTLVDFGQNLVGRLRLTVQGAAGHTITLRHAEVLENGELSTRPLRFAAATDAYTLHGRHGDLGAALYVSWLSLRRSDGLAGRTLGRCHLCCGNSLRPGAHGLVPLLRPAGQPAA